MKHQTLKFVAAIDMLHTFLRVLGIDHFQKMNSFGIEDFAQKYGDLKPSQFVDVISLVGDKADNIPGPLIVIPESLYRHYASLSYVFSWEKVLMLSNLMGSLGNGKQV
ncbi:unnamed protein product [Ilex paraguariensis]|uniref:Uncharacterized protein n=1 Tax=Ilex paraguariensis TaxID=185542 RepID=A0ABC8URR3_9AQUA